MKYLNELSSLSHSVYVLRKRQKATYFGEFCYLCRSCIRKSIAFFELLILLLKISVTEASIRMLVPRQDEYQHDVSIQISINVG